MPRVQPSQPIIADLANLQDRIIAVKLALDGAFKDELKQLQEQLDAVSEKLGMVETVEAAEQIRDEAETFAAQKQSDINALLDKANAASAAASSKLTLIEARELAVGAKEAGVTSRTAQLDARERAIADAQTQTDAQQRDREATLVKLEADYQTRSKKLAADIAAFNQRLEALKA